MLLFISSIFHLISKHFSTPLNMLLQPHLGVSLAISIRASAPPPPPTELCSQGASPQDAQL